MSGGKVSLEGFTRGQVEGLIGAECHALGVGLLELFLVQVGAHLGHGVLAVARFKLLPRLSDWAEEGLCGAVEHTCPCQSPSSAARQARPRLA